jgi:hypothetical protein
MPIVVAVGKQMNGAVFQLHPKTKAMLEAKVPGWSPASNSVFLAFKWPWDFGRIQGPMWAQVVMLLTGFSEDQLQDLGGFTFMLPRDNEVVFESHAA